MRTTHPLSIICTVCSLSAVMVACPLVDNPNYVNDGGGVADRRRTESILVHRNVDVLLVVGNHFTMAGEAPILSQNFGYLIETLQDADLDYRAGITTTDNGNPWCPPGATTPEAGALVVSSCRDRLSKFVFNNAGIDMRDAACNDVCDVDSANLDISPTTTENDAEPKPRPWLEYIDGHKNISDPTDIKAAFECFAPQGFYGCSYAQPLESMRLALARSREGGEKSYDIEESYDFVRNHAVLAIVILSDMPDCSYNENWSSIFEMDGDRAFWSDPDATFPTLAVCWNAGVECIGEADQYDICQSANKSVDGGVAATDADSVLHPMSRYISFVQELETEKQDEGAPEQDVVVVLISGVDHNGIAHYGDVDQSDPVFQNSYGIGPGCTAPPPPNLSESLEATPPVRLREFAEAFGTDNIFSICETDFSPAFDALGQKIEAELPVGCFPDCVADTEPEQDKLQPDCTVAVTLDDQQLEISECVIDPDTQEAQLPSADVDTCYVVHTGDDLATQCRDGGYNLQFGIVHRAGAEAPPPTQIRADCLLADDSSVCAPD